MQNAHLQANESRPNEIPLSYGQKALWLLYRLSPNRAAYNVQFAWRIRGGLELEKLQKVLLQLTNRHASLRTTYRQDPTGNTSQIINEKVSFSLERLDASTWNDERIFQIISAQRYRPFHLETGPVWRWVVFKKSSQEHVLMMSVHHIAIDMWSLMILLHELSVGYQALSQGQTLAEIWPPLEASYQDFIEEHTRLVQGPRGEKLWEFWQKQLAGNSSPLELPTDKPRLPTIRYQGEAYTVSLPAHLSERLHAFAQQEQVTLSTLYLSAYQILLHRYTDQSQILVSSPTGGRQTRYRHNVGYFVNPLIFRADFSENPSFRQFLQTSQKKNLLALLHREFPFVLLVERLQPVRDPSRSPLAQVSFLWDDPNGFGTQPLVEWGTQGEELWKIGGLDWERLALKGQVDDFDLLLKVTQIQGKITLTLEYNTDLFEFASIERMLENLKMLLSDLLEHPDLPVSRLSILNERDRHKILEEWNATQRPFSENACIHELFEAQAHQHPQREAVLFERTKLTYQELNQQANQLAHYLQQQGIGPEKLVGLCLERSHQMIVALMAILKAGSAYVPLDPKYPQERLNLILEESQAELILTQSHLFSRWEGKACKLLALDHVMPQLALFPISSPTVSMNSRHLSHVIYTSGSTGRPKGVAIEHRSVAALIQWMSETFTMEELSGVLGSTSLNFDLSVFEIQGTLCLGGSLIVAENALHLPSLPAVSRVKLVNTVPSAIKELLRMRSLPNSVCTVNLAGEPLSSLVVKELYRLPHLRRVLNLYGPTEDTTYSTFALMPRQSDRAPSIGRPLSNTQVYILDKWFQPVPIGVRGELYIGGEGLARGYLNRPELTQERFLPHPFDPSRRVYKTGDLVRYAADGTLDFLGRIDHQVKIRGFRIELGEIEAILYQHPRVAEVLVTDRESSALGKVLVAYLTLKPEQQATPAEIREFLKTRLPDYMVPTFLLILDAMPLNPNGKIDRKLLPNPELNEQDPNSNLYLKPRNEIERTLVEIWKKVLQLEEIGMEENFFDLGGHSLLMTQVYSLLPEFWKTELTVVDLFQYPSIVSLAERLSEHHVAEMAKAEDPTQSIRRAKERLKDVPGLKIAVIGMAGRFPGANNIDEFWQNIQNGVDCIKHYTEEELAQSGLEAKLWQHPQYVRAGGQLENIEMFDASFFGFSPREAQITDPQHRLFLECCWEALENAGIASERFKRPIGVYAGSGMNSYYVSHLSQYPALLQQLGVYPLQMGNEKDYLCSRVSYKLNLSGPGVSIQTACSTSLVAVHLACRGLLSGECDVALAGGVSLGNLQKGYLYQEGMILSPDGKCRAFDAQAQGTVPGQGVGVVVLKRLEDALQDRYHIHAVILGSAINNDGSNKVGFTAPGAEGQAQVIQSAHIMAGVTADSIGYVETHGTGTSVGDPIEMIGLTKAFYQSTPKKQFCAIGSVKTNLGHLDAAAGVTGLIKTVLALKHQQIPPSLYYQTPNPQINFAESPFYVNTKLQSWTTEGETRRAGVSAFGLGGTNAHLVVEEAPASSTGTNSRPWALLTLSAKTPEALEAMTDCLIEHWKLNPRQRLADVAYTLQMGRNVFPYRRVVVCENRHDAILTLSKRKPQRLFDGFSPGGQRPIAFMFSGQGTQYVKMGAQLYQEEPVYRKAIDECREVLKKRLPELYYSLSEEDLQGATERLHDPDLTPPMLFMVGYAICQLFIEWGIRPNYLLGHSLGEYTAACLAGVFSLEDALVLVTLRGKLIQDPRIVKGEMLSVRLSEKKLLPLLPLDLSLAGINGPERCVVAGKKESIRQFRLLCEENQIDVKRLHTASAFHSALLDPILEDYLAIVKNIPLHKPQLPFLSNVTGTWITDEEAISPEYWVRHMREPVRFSQNVETLLNQEPNLVLLETSPGNVLSTLVQQHPSKTTQHLILPTIRHAQEDRHDREFLLNTLGKLWMIDVPIHWEKFYGTHSQCRVELPSYPFERKRYWIDRPAAQETPEAQKLSDLVPALPEVELSQSVSPPMPVSPLTATERQLIEIWQEYLGLERIGVHDNFFMLGGDSLVAIRLMARIREHFKVGLTSHILLNHSTISALAACIEEERHPMSQADKRTLHLLVEIQAGTPEFPRLFLIHPGGGHVFFYHDLARQIGTQQAVYGIQARGLNGLEPPIDRIETMATRYLEEIRAFQPQGPYLLGGASFGGIVAYEMAQQLLAEGQPPALLMMVDSPGPGHMPRRFRDNAELLMHLFPQIPLSESRLRTLEPDPEEQIEYMLEQASIAKMQHVLPSDFGTVFLDVVNAHLRAMYAYVPRPYSESLIFFKHTFPLEGYDAAPDQAWKSLVQGEIKVYNIPGNHLTMNFLPHVKTLATFFKPHLRKLSERR